ncbi:MAG: hypothetical protein ABI175_14655, partial [Polyangiales bacterium]
AEGTGRPSNMVRTELHVHRDGKPARRWDWQIAATRGPQPSVTFPQLPVGDFDFMPAATDSYGVRDLETADLPGGYATYREQALRTRLDVVTPGFSGQLSYQQLYQQLFSAQE